MSTTVTYQVAASGDDGHTRNAFAFFSLSNNGILGSSAGAPTKTWLRFVNVSVPNGATINAAHIEYKAYSSKSADSCITRMYFNAGDDAAAPTTYDEYTGKALTAAYTNWTIGAWDENSWYSSPDIKDIVQEIVDRSGWTAGNAMMLLHVDNGSTSDVNRAFYTYDATPTYAPKLVIEYTEGGTSVTVTAVVGEASAEALASIPHADVLVVGGIGEASAEALAANPTTALIVLGAVASAVSEALPATPHADVLVQASVAESTAEALPATALYNIHVTVLAATAEASAEALPAEPLAQRNITVEAAIGTATAEALAAIVRAGKKLYWVIKYQ
jgi:hypothetical protein